MNIRSRHAGLLGSLFLILSILSSGVGSIALAAQTADGTSTFHGDAARTGEQPGPAPVGEPVVVWEFQTGAAVRSSPVTADGVLFIGSNDGYFYALDAITGAERWRFQTGGRVTASAAVADGTAYIGSTDGFVYAIDVASGEQRWRFFAAELNYDVSQFIELGRQRGMITSSIAVEDGLVFVTSNSFKVTAINAETGIERWHFIAAGANVTTPAIRDGTLYVASEKGVNAIEASTGRRIWTALFIVEDDQDETDESSDGDGNQSDPDPTQESDDSTANDQNSDVGSGLDSAGSIAVPTDVNLENELPLNELIAAFFPQSVSWQVSAAPVVVDDQVVILVHGSSEDVEAAASGTQSQEEDLNQVIISTDLISLDVATGAVVGAGYFYAWEPTIGSPAVVDGRAYFGVDQGLLYAYDIDQGGERWGVQTEAWIASAPVVADETVFFGNDDGVVFALAAETGVEQWRFETGGAVRSSPVVQDGLVYFGSDDGTVYAIGDS